MKNQAHSKPTDMRVLASRLQAEVDVILASASDQTIVAEFHEDKVIDLVENGRHETIHEIFDERITYHPRKKPALFVRQKRMRDKIRSFIKFLFTPLSV